MLHTAYAYDRAGNRTSVQAGDRREIYHYDRGRLTTRTVERAQDPAGKTYTYRYDAQGNTLGDGENTYLYDCLNRIAEVQTKAGDIQKNHYDAEGLRSQMEENGKLVSFIYADREVITEEDEAGEHIRYIRGHELLASDSERARTYYHYACDEMGSITDITDCHGTVLNHYAYDAFGNRTVEEETVENRFGFAGEMLDAVTGQYYLRARFYNPVIARFLSEDTYYGDGLILYAYCHNNPVGYVDPSGHEGLICSKKYGELKKKETEGGTLSEKEKRQIYEYEQNQKKSNGAGSDSKNTIKGGIGERLIPGMEGVVTGGDSTKLGKNMMESMGLPRGTNWTGHQAQHIIPAEMANHPVLQRIGMDLDDASNGLFLRTPGDDISAMSRHRGYHSIYNEFVKTQLDAMDVSQSVDVLQKQVYDLQQNLKYLQQSGLPLYPSQGATVDLWQRSLERIQ